MLSRHHFGLFGCAVAVALLTLTGCSNSTDPAASSGSAAATDSATVAPDRPTADAAAAAADATSESSGSTGAQPSDEPTKNDFLAAAQRGVIVADSSPSKDDAPPFVSTPDNPGPKEPLFSDPPAPEPGVDRAWREKWVTNFEKAKAIALAEKKDILMNFTGSDWCGWCIRLGREVFQHAEFADYAQKNFVLLELDFPRGFELEESLQKQNDALQAQFAVEGFPSILLTDAQGRAYAQTGYQAGGPNLYIEHLETLKGFRETRDAAFAEAEKLAGAEKAKKLDEGLAALQPSLMFASYPETVDQIIALDADGSAGLKKKYESARAEFQFSQRMQAIVAQANETGDWDAVLADLDKVITDYAAFDELVVQAQMLQLQVLRIAKRADDLIKVADQLLADKSLEREMRLQVYVNKLRTLDEADRTEEALPVIDAMLTDFADQTELRINLLMTKARFLARLGQKDAAKATIQKVRESADPSMLSQIDEYEKDILAESEKPAAESSK